MNTVVIGLHLLNVVMFTSAVSGSAMEQQLASAARQRDSVGAMFSSVRIQQTAVRRQRQLAPIKPDDFFVALDSERGGSGVVQDCAPIGIFEAQGLTENAARKAGIDPNLLHAVVSQESAWRPCAVSVKGAQGLTQLMPATAADLGVRDPFDAAQSLAGGAALLKQLITRYSGDLNRVLGAYNAGPARVDAAGGIPPIPETENYVEKVLGRLP